MAIRASWHQLGGFIAAGTSRSSHVLALLHGSKRLVQYSGELKPREAVPGDTAVFDLIGHQWSTAVSAAASPPARVGAASATIGDRVYVFGGRAGLAMAPLSENGVWEFEPSTGSWTFLEDAPGDAPQQRSYHALTSDDKETLYLHAGCPEKGRLADLWSYKPRTRVWTRLADAPAPARGGPTFAYLAAKQQLVRFGGYDGKTQQGGATDVFDLASGTWSTLQTDLVPPSRSVSALVPIDNGRRLVCLFGEREASSLGHAGAGRYHADAWVFDGSSWSPVEYVGDARPVQRGWFAAAPGAAADEVVLSGGLSEDNERLGDAWVLKFESF
eukprot:TRINITY_DN6007_c0_g2_i1.p2 TRINITY_DN6007_c0_g2~~TRINITY_DN6007_c0_g2_i1.p2  ORF type:complete len:329 (+),score=64.59 TRINITY_DN6007_c0_g2_i1:2068-3054(+)